MLGWMGCLLAAVLAGMNGTAGEGPLAKAGTEEAVPKGRVSAEPMPGRASEALAGGGDDAAGRVGMGRIG